jgi:hypothetical protein
MEEVKTLGIREGEEIFLSYKDDNEQIVTGYFILLKMSEVLLQLKTNSNILAIPVSRILKIKQRYSQ